MKSYEAMFIVDPTVTDSDTENLVKSFEGELTSDGGTILTRELQGKRVLSYKIKGFREGSYVLLNFQAPSQTILKMEKKLKLTPQVLRYLLIKS